MVQAVIFDVDGTLVDSVDLHAQAWQDAFRAFGHDIAFGKIREQIGKGGDQLMPVFLTEAELGRIGEQLEAHRGEVFKQRYLAQVKPFPQVRSLIQRLLQDGCRVALASSAKQAELQSYKQIAGIDDLIETETTSDDAERSKPHPDIFAAALQRMGDVDQADVRVVGDTPYDAQAANKAGMQAIGMLSGGWTEPDLRQAGCIAVYDNPAALLRAYEASGLTGLRA